MKQYPSRKELAKAKVQNIKTQIANTKGQEAPQKSARMGLAQEHSSGAQWMDESSFACKSVEIINTKTVVSRNNTRFEIYQYQHDETTLKDNPLEESDAERKPDTNPTQSGRIREAASDYMRNSDETKREDSEVRGLKNITIQLLNQQPPSALDTPSPIKAPRKVVITEEAKASTRRKDRENKENNQYAICIRAAPLIQLPSLSSFVNSSYNHGGASSATSLQMQSYEAGASLLSIKDMIGGLQDHEKKIYECYGIMMNSISESTSINPRDASSMNEQSADESQSYLQEASSLDNIDVQLNYLSHIYDLSIQY